MSPHSIHRYVYITLKDSLRWVPILGWVRITSNQPIHMIN
jgi:1-acyl-sn-glycerol-3-phosphate acyltransferase